MSSCGAAATPAKGAGEGSDDLQRALTLHCGRMLARRGPGAHGWPNVRAAARTRPDGKQAHAAHGSRDSWYSRRARLRKLRRHAGLRVAALRQSGRLHHPDMLAGPPVRRHVRLGLEGAECVPRGVSRWLYGRGGGRESPHRRTSGVLELGCNARSLARKLFPMPPSASAVAASSWAMTCRLRTGSASPAPSSGAASCRPCAAPARARPTPPFARASFPSLLIRSGWNGRPSKRSSRLRLRAPQRTGCIRPWPGC